VELKKSEPRLENRIGEKNSDAQLARRRQTGSVRRRQTISIHSILIHSLLDVTPVIKKKKKKFCDNN
jgi:hypothetical protein